MKILSLFDGMACGMLAMMEAGIKVDRYVAFEIDKYAVQTSSHNFQMIEHRGDVFQADFTEFSGFDFLVGGSPCTYWSIAQKNNRETEASGMGWELFSQYVRALHEAKPMWFIYENNKSMSKAIRESITETFGFEPICINSALVSAQNRQRLYWVGRRNLDGTYSRVKVEQPEDRGILLRDVLDCGFAWKDKQNTLDANYFKGGNLTSPNKQSGQRFAVAEPVAINATADGKAQCIRATCYKDGIRNIVGNDVDKKTGVAEPVKELTEREMDYMVRSTNGKYSDRWAYLQKPGENDKALCITANISKGVPYNICAEPVCLNSKSGRGGVDGLQPSLQDRIYSIDGKHTAVTTAYMPKIAEPIRVGTYPNDAKNQAHDSQQYRIYSTDGKGVTLCGNGGGMCAKTGLYAVPLNETEDGKSQTIKAQYHFTSIPNICCYSSTYGATGVACPTDQPPSEQFTGTGKDMNAMKRVYEVKDGQITIKGKQYPIKLIDGYYIIRKLTVSECKRLQTVPEWYDFPVSDTQAYKMLGNGWTVEVIAHLIRATQTNEQDEGQLNIFDMAGEVK